MVNTDKIRTQVHKLKEETLKWKTGGSHIGLNVEQFTVVMQEECSYLYKNSATLFEKCIEGKMDLSRLEEMLSMIESVSNGKDYFTASKEIGQSLTDTYVKTLNENKKKQ